MADKPLEDLDPSFREWLAISRPADAPTAPPSLEQLRDGFSALMQAYATPMQSTIEKRDVQLPSRDAGRTIGCRLYRHRAGADAQALTVFAHGGGWVVGDLETHDSLCQDIAVSSKHAVLAIDYRRSPEHVFPAAMHDMLDVLEALPAEAAALGIDASRIVLGGDSAGGSIATASCLSLAKDRQHIRGLWLIYPALGADTSLPSYSENANIPSFTAEELMFFATAYFGSTTTLPDPLAAPLTVKDLSALPPSFVSVAQYDLLRDDGRVFADRLKQAGVSVQLQETAKFGHAWLWVRQRSAAAQAYFAAACSFLDERLRG